MRSRGILRKGDINMLVKDIEELSTRAKNSLIRNGYITLKDINKADFYDIFALPCFKRNPCKECDYYCATNNTCQRKKHATYNPYVGKLDKMFCDPYKVDKK